MLTAEILFEICSLAMGANGDAFNLIHDSTFHILAVWALKKCHNNIYLVKYSKFMSQFCQRASSVSLINAFLKTNLISDFANFFMDNILGISAQKHFKDDFTYFFFKILSSIKEIENRQECRGFVRELRKSMNWKYLEEILKGRNVDISTVIGDIFQRKIVKAGKTEKEEKNKRLGNTRENKNSGRVDKIGGNELERKGKRQADNYKEIEEIKSSSNISLSESQPNLTSQRQINQNNRFRRHESIIFVDERMARPSVYGDYLIQGGSQRSLDNSESKKVSVKNPVDQISMGYSSGQTAIQPSQRNCQMEQQRSLHNRSPVNPLESPKLSVHRAKPKANFSIGIQEIPEKSKDGPPEGILFLNHQINHKTKDDYTSSQPVFNLKKPSPHKKKKSLVNLPKI